MQNVTIKTTLSKYSIYIFLVGYQNRNCHWCKHKTHCIDYNLTAAFNLENLYLNWLFTQSLN